MDLFLVAMIIWDIGSRGGGHRVTLIGGLAVIWAQPLRMMSSAANGWPGFAAWAVGLLGRYRARREGRDSPRLAPATPAG